MDQATHNKIVSFIWGIADDVLRDLFVRGKYRDVILSMFVLRRLDAVLEPTKQAVLDTKKMLDDANITEQKTALCSAAGQPFYNTSAFRLRDLKARASQQQLKADFEAYLDGFSPNVQDILTNFEFRNNIPRLSKADALGALIAKFLDRDIDLSPAAIDNHAMFAAATALHAEIGGELFEDHNVFRERVAVAAKKRAIKLAPAELKIVLRAVSWRVESAPPVIAKEYKPGKATADPIRGRFEASADGKTFVVEYEPDPDLRDPEQVPLQEDVEAFLGREVLPYAENAWFDDSQTKIGYEISFTRHFYKPQPLRTLDQIRADIVALEKETENLLSEIVKGGKA
jgi:hypothetical protein